MTEERREYAAHAVPADGHAAVSPGCRAFAEPDADPLPERFDYRDEGCELYPLCLECPLPYCRHDRLAGRRTKTRLRDDELLKQRRRESKSVAELAESFGVSKRTVQRIIRRSASE
ncbi:MAG: hypothetical protein IBX68_11325 [Dehalococcoidia bacterium]|nr:hypothetical protein [Dehalococcoidia bacterium]